MHLESWELWGVFGTLALGVLSAIVAVFGSAINLSIKLGMFRQEHAQLRDRVNELEDRIKVSEDKLIVIDLMKASIDDIRRQMVSLRRDIIHLIRGKVKVAFTLGGDDEESEGEDEHGQ